MTNYSSKMLDFASIAISPKIDFKSYFPLPSNREAYEYFHRFSNVFLTTTLPRLVVLKHQRGTGGSHLVKCYLSEVLRKQNLSVMYLSGGRFMEYLIAALRNNKMADFRERMRKQDIFVLDDLESAAGRRATQEELIFTFESLIENNSQIICISTCSPTNLKDFNDKLKNLLLSFAVLEIKRPTYPERVELARFGASQMNLELENEEMRDIAKKSTKSIHQLVCFLQQVKMKRELGIECSFPI